MTPHEPWPRAVVDAPVLRGLDERARRELQDAGRLFDVAAGDLVYGAGDAGTSFFVVAAGRVALTAIRRGDEHESELRSAGPGDSFGEESTVGLARRGAARATSTATLAEVPVHVFRRAAARSGKADVADRLMRSLARAATGDLLRQLAFTRSLPARDLDVLLDAINHRRVERGEHVYREGDPPRELFLVADGMVQVQRETEGRLHVQAYLGRGDFFGDVELAASVPRRTSVIASGAALLLAVPAKVFLDVAARHPDLLMGLRRLAGDQEALQRAVVAPAAANATQHAFRDLYRLQIARSLLVIDLETCVRCGHCAWACSSVHGVARLVRRGDKVVSQLLDQLGDSGAPQHLMLPSSCQHCENPACMVGCPTGAIGRDPGGEVFIREELCTGCGACAKACPWDNIQMAARGPGSPPPPSAGLAEVAVKCDLCRAYDGPACVKACPTGAIFRLNPAEELLDVRALLRGEVAPTAGAELSGASSRGAPSWSLLAGAAIAAVGIGGAGATLQRRGVLEAGHGLGLAAGACAGVAMLALLAYAWPKRRIRNFLRLRASGVGPVRSASIVRPQLGAHVAIGLVTVGLAVAHAPAHARLGFGGALLDALVLSSILGAWLALAYRVVPRRLARIERTATLPEDFGRARDDLEERLYRDATGKSDLVKKILETVLLPYSRSPLGPLALIASGRSLRDEEAALSARIDALLEGRGKERLAGLSSLTRTVVELRALPAQRWLQRALRAALPAHVVTFTIAVALLVLHVAVALFGRA
jgi:Fe-S-cluster-containing dehydrogenase component/CRP-like cAMP-binding protein